LAVNRRLLREQLEPRGFVVSEAASGALALDAVTRAGYDVVFLDLRMPGMDGFELARRLAALPGGGPKRIATSASVFAFHRATAIDAGCHDFLPKPFLEEQLFEILGAVLDLVWLREAPAPAPAGAAMPAATVLEAWLDLAQRGDVVGLRAALEARHAAHPEEGRFLAALGELAAQFRM